jgi:hypothetical protein
VILTGDGAPEALNRLAREQMKVKLLADINVDLTVCEIEGWDAREYLRDLHLMIARHDPCNLTERAS